MEDLILKHPELAQFVVPNVRPTGKTIGVGSYGSVEEVVIYSYPEPSAPPNGPTASFEPLAMVTFLLRNVK